MRKFKHKLTHKDLLVLIDLLESITENSTQSVIGFISISLLKELHTRLSIKAITNKKGQEQTVSMKDYEAVNFWVIVNPTIAHDNIDAIQIQKMCNEIHRQIISNKHLSLKNEN